MAAYIIIIREETIEPSELLIYAQMACWLGWFSSIHQGIIRQK